MQMILMVITAFIIAAQFDMGFFPAALVSVVIWSILWPVAQSFMGGGQAAAPAAGQEGGAPKEG
ncbi:MAG: hypothetical protein EPO32_04680 [Anaerolineae bacterium]|nr:MAG: hypothetical protein EPO32_04680 [Anaerolineae bacterium]